MKKLIVSLLMVAGVSAALAQGTVGSVTFNTFNGGNAAQGRVFLADAVTGPGPTFVGQLWYDTGGGLFAALGTPQPFDSLTPYTIQDGSVTVPGSLGGDSVSFQLRVWNSAAGLDWNTATSNGSPTPSGNPLLTDYGISGNKSRILGGADVDNNPFSPQQFNTFANFNLTVNPVIPEPTTIALVGLGVAALLAFRRRS